MGTRDEEVDFLNRHITKENCLIEGPRGGMGHLWGAGRGCYLRLDLFIQKVDGH